jgi:hypothetical protein
VSPRPDPPPRPGGRDKREGPPRARRPRLAAELWRDGTAQVLLARAYAGFVARRGAGLACELCAHEGARAVTGDRRLTAGPHRGTCALGCYAGLEALDYRVAALNPGEVRRGPPLHPATVEAVCRRLLARAAELGRRAAAGRPARARAPRAAPAGALAAAESGRAAAAARGDDPAPAPGRRIHRGARRGVPEEVS